MNGNFLKTFIQLKLLFKILNLITFVTYSVTIRCKNYPLRLAQCKKFYPYHQ